MASGDEGRETFMENGSMKSDRWCLCRKLVALLASLSANVALLFFLVHDQIAVRRNFNVIRIVAGEYAIQKVEERLGPPHHVFHPGAETGAWPFAGSNGHRPQIKGRAYLYATPEARYVVYADREGYVDNILCASGAMLKGEGH